MRAACICGRSQSKTTSMPRLTRRRTRCKRKCGGIKKKNSRARGVHRGNSRSLAGIGNGGFLPASRSRTKNSPAPKMAQGRKNLLRDRCEARAELAERRIKHRFFRKRGRVYGHDRVAFFVERATRFTKDAEQEGDGLRVRVTAFFPVIVCAWRVFGGAPHGFFGIAEDEKPEVNARSNLPHGDKGLKRVALCRR